MLSVSKLTAPVCPFTLVTLSASVTTTQAPFFLAYSLPLLGASTNETLAVFAVIAFACAVVIVVVSPSNAVPAVVPKTIETLAVLFVIAVA